MTRGDAQEGGLILKPVALSAQSSALAWQRISGQHQGRRILFSAQEGRRHDCIHDQRNPEINP